MPMTLESRPAAREPLGGCPPPHRANDPRDATRRPIHLVSVAGCAASATLRAMLLHKGLAFGESEAPRPLGEGAGRAAADSPSPSIHLDGRRWTDGAVIARELDRLVLTRPLWPGSRRTAALSHGLACWADASLGAALQLHRQQASLQALHRLKCHLSHADSLLDDPPFLLGLQPWLCDFALYGQLSVMQQQEGTLNLMKLHLNLVAFFDRMRSLEQR